jgi:hypothetical protein
MLRVLCAARRRCLPARLTSGGPALASGLGVARVLTDALTPAQWAGVGCGAALALLYGLASWATHRWALRQATATRLMTILVGGLLARMAAALAACVLVLVAVPVARGAFMGSFFGVFVLALTLEVWSLHRHARPAA